MLMLFVFPLCCCCCAALCWLIQLWTVRLHHGMHANGWEWEYQNIAWMQTELENIDRRLDTFRLVCVCVRSFAWLFHCCYFHLPRETEECVVFFPFAGSNSISSFIGVWAWLLCMYRHDYRCQESNTKLWKCIVSATVEMSISAQYTIELPPFRRKLIASIGFHSMKFSFMFGENTHLPIFTTCCTVFFGYKLKRGHILKGRAVKCKWNAIDVFSRIKSTGIGYYMCTIRLQWTSPKAVAAAAAATDSNIKWKHWTGNHC